MLPVTVQFIVAMLAYAINERMARRVTGPARADRLCSHDEECLRRIIPLGERHLRKIAEYVEHYHLERNHQGLSNQLIVPAPFNRLGRVKRRERLGGMLSFDYRDAA
jgi:hypothetical protein